MKDIRQIQLITDSLNKEREKHLYELAKLNNAIANKQALIDKMLNYQSDYHHEDNLQLSKSVPGLHKNINLFSRKIDGVINQTGIEMDLMKKLRSKTLLAIENVNKKLEMMGVFANKSHIENRAKENKQEQTTIDDIAATTEVRGDHE